MGKSLDEIRIIKADYAREHHDGKVVKTVGITSVGIAAQYEPHFKRRPGESLEDLCLGVGVAALFQRLRISHQIHPHWLFSLAVRRDNLFSP